MMTNRVIIVDFFGVQSFGTSQGKPLLSHILPFLRHLFNIAHRLSTTCQSRYPHVVRIYHSHVLYISARSASILARSIRSSIAVTCLSPTGIIIDVYGCE